MRHDIHHLLTGYKSELLGEFEIAAWEIASGCMNYFAAYLLNSGGLLAGIFFYPRPTFRAFLIGCRTTNLYQLNIDDKTLKNSTIDDLKKQLGLEPLPSINMPSFLEIMKLTSHLILSFILQTLVFILSPLLIVYNFWMHGKRVFGK